MARSRASKADGGLVSAILKYLATQRDVLAERQNAGKMPFVNRAGERHLYTLGAKGALDLRGYMRRAGETAIPFEIEAKRLGGKTRKSQVDRMRALEALGVPCCKVESVGEVVRFLEELRRR